MTNTGFSSDSTVHWEGTLLIKTFHIQHCTLCLPANIQYCTVLEFSVGSMAWLNYNAPKITSVYVWCCVSCEILK